LVREIARARLFLPFGTRQATVTPLLLLADVSIRSQVMLPYREWSYELAF
jgi:hypothetical protein